MNYAITIGRQLGSGGKKLGELLSQKLGIACYDKELIQLASRESGLGREFFERADEQQGRGFFGHLLGFRAGYVGEADNVLCGEKLFQIQSDIIRQLAERESCIFVGRCADYILREHERCLKLFVSAALPDRIAAITRSENLSEREATQRIEQADHKRAEYYHFYTGKQWGSAASYDLCASSSVFGLEGIAEIVGKIVGKFEDLKIFKSAPLTR
jgi:cytidylate kinase